MNIEEELKQEEAHIIRTVKDMGDDEKRAYKLGYADGSYANGMYQQIKETRKGRLDSASYKDLEELMKELDSKKALEDKQ